MTKIIKYYFSTFFIIQVTFVFSHLIAQAPRSTGLLPSHFSDKSIVKITAEGYISVIEFIGANDIYTLPEKKSWYKLRVHFFDNDKWQTTPDITLYSSSIAFPNYENIKANINYAGKNVYLFADFDSTENNLGENALYFNQGWKGMNNELKVKYKGGEFMSASILINDQLYYYNSSIVELAGQKCNQFARLDLNSHTWHRLGNSDENNGFYSADNNQVPFTFAKISNNQFYFEYFKNYNQKMRFLEDSFTLIPGDRIIINGQMELKKFNVPFECGYLGEFKGKFIFLSNTQLIFVDKVTLEKNVKLLSKNLHFNTQLLREIAGVQVNTEFLICGKLNAGDRVLNFYRILESGDISLIAKFSDFKNAVYFASAQRIYSFQEKKELQKLDLQNNTVLANYNVGNSAIWEYDGLKSSVTGTVFADLDKNGVFSTGDYPLTDVWVSAVSDKDKLTVHTDASGKFELELGEKTWYQLKYSISSRYNSVWDVDAVSTWVNNIPGTVTVLPPALIRNRGIKDLGIRLVSLSGNSVLRNDTLFGQLIVENNSSNVFNNVNTKFYVDTNYSLISMKVPYYPTPEKGVYAIDFNAILPNDVVVIPFKIYVPLNRNEVGNTRNISVKYDQFKDDEIKNNSYDLVTDVVDKQLYNKKYSNLNGEIDESITVVKYSIHFRNLKPDSCKRVIVYDTLDQHIELSKVIVNTSHKCHTYIIKPNILKIVFEDVNLVPFRSDDLRSGGYVHLEVRFSKPLRKGTKISNSARIVFENGGDEKTNKVWFKQVGDNIISIPDEAFAYNKIALVPNPAKGYVHVAFASSLPRTIRIYDAVGKLIREEMVIQNIKMVDLKDFAPGVYFVQSSDKHSAKLFVSK